MKPKVFEGIKLIEFGSFIAGPAASMMFSTFGAEIIKVEHPTRFDGARLFQTGIGHPTPDPKFGSQFFNVSNMGKKSLAVDYRTPDGKEILKDLLKEADVLFENMIPGALSDNGFSYEEIKEYNPDIIYISSCSCGQTGPERNYRGYAGHFAAKSGISYITGYEEKGPAVFTGGADFRSATNTMIALILTLLHRQRTGEGQYVDIASQEAIATQIGDVFLDYILNGTVPARQGNRRDGYCPNGAFKTTGNDQWITISCTRDEEFKALAEAMGRPELAADPRFGSYESRKANEDELENLINEWTLPQTKQKVWELLVKAGVPCAPTYNAMETATDRNCILRESCKAMEHKYMDRDYVVNTPWRWMSETPSENQRYAPILGEHTAEVLKSLNRSGEDIEKYEKAGVIRIYREE